MNKEILINLTPRETRVALVEDGLLHEIFIDREKKRSLVSNIYKGKVVRVLPGMDAAFVDIGLERAAFLHAQDIHSRCHDLESSTIPSDNLPTINSNSIKNLVQEGQEIVVQIIKEPFGTKGARLTTHLSIPSRYAVLLANSNATGVSIRIEDEKERERLKQIITNQQQILGEEGYILRTVAEGIEESILSADIQFLKRLWDSLKNKIDQTKTGQLIYEDLPLELRTLRDCVDDCVHKILIDSRRGYQAMTTFAEQFLPETLNKIQLYSGSRPIFDLYNIEDEIEKGLRKKVTLKSGGYLYIEQTEAMTTIDVNTGAYVGHKNLEETIFKTNLEATQVIARQLRLRNIGGIIILDFIDMISENHRSSVLEALNQHLAKDHTKINVSEVTSLGLVQLTRKRTRDNLEHILCNTCPTCEGRGSIKSAETVCYQIFREIIRESKQYPHIQQFLILAAPNIVEIMLDEESQNVAELEAFIHASIRLQSEPLYNNEQFDIVLR